MSTLIDNISLVIQGNLHQRCLDCLPYYQKYVKDIVISYWNNDHNIYELDGIKWISNILPEKPPYYLGGTLYWQAMSTLYGIICTSNQYILKIRGDESYTDISKILQCIKDNPEKLTTNNVWFGADNDKFKISDHAWGGKRSKLIDYLQTMLIPVVQCTKPPPAERHAYGTPPEKILSTCWIKFCGDEIDDNKSKDLMKKHIAMVPVSEMGEYVVMGGGNIFTTNEEIRNNPSIFSMDEL